MGNSQPITPMEDTPSRQGFSTYYIESIHSEVYHTKQGHENAFVAVHIPTVNKHTYPICSCNTENTSVEPVEKPIDSKKFATLYRSCERAVVYHALKGHYCARILHYVPREQLGECIVCDRCWMAFDRVDYSQKYTSLYYTLENPSVYHWDSKKCGIEPSKEQLAKDPNIVNKVLLKKTFLTENLYKHRICKEC